MGVSAALSPTTLAVVPGGEASAELVVRNTGTVVDHFSMEVVGEAAQWATVEPQSVSIFPGDSATARLVVRPPRAPDVAAGELAFAVRVVSREQADASVAEEGTIQVAAFSDVAAQLTPRTSRGSRLARHELAIDNRGNTPIRARVRVSAADEFLLFAVDPEVVSVMPNTAAFVTLRARPRKTFLRGPDKPHTFDVVVEPEEAPPVTLPASMVQEATLPRWAPRAAMAALLGVVLLGILWAALVRPSIRSAARAAVARELTPPSIGAGDPDGGSGASGRPAAGSVGSPSGGTGSAAGTAGAVAGGAALEVPIDGRLFLTDDGTTSFEVPEGKVLQLTDIVLQNPNGEAGSLQVRRNGTPLLVVELANFRDLDYHFVAPIVFRAGQKLELAADCSSPTCTPGAYFSGFLANV